MRDFLTHRCQNSSVVVLPGFLFDMKGTATNTTSFATSADQLQPSASKAVTKWASRLDKNDLNDPTELCLAYHHVSMHWAAIAIRPGGGHQVVHLDTLGRSGRAANGLVQVSDMWGPPVRH